MQSDTTSKTETSSDFPVPRVEGDSLVVTIDENENLLELIFVNADGIYVRDSGAWILEDSEGDLPTINDMEWLDVEPEFIPEFDKLMQTSDELTRDMVVPYTASQV